MKFKKGDVVQLRSGGALMTVELVDNEDGEVELDLVWMNEAGEMQTAKGLDAGLVVQRAGA